MTTSGKNKKFIEMLREKLKEELEAQVRTHHKILSRERDELRKVLSQEVERLRRRKPSYVLGVLRGLSWVS
ncbi:MAG: hypothetical protein LZ158_01475 [Thaumarchaeota archaeon]|jgi:siroheme synthase (precorrin-2 oxidase/ferrochelatase)|nr:hypothetical protein [Candidatus Terraquivivens yellowstonensis]MCL7394670.1 hypothetical protein [Candidatus Terraquivivens yellowstonensis]MCL7399153.1 hypothetical protein [Candidatus Terraquivivens yellowstonensis]